MSPLKRSAQFEIAPSLNEQIYAKLRQEIMDGHIRPGERLVELVIAKRFGVSQAPVREALRRLSQEGVAVNEPRRGTRVRELTLSEIEELYEVRAELEVFAAQRFVDRINPETTRLLQRAFADLKRASRSTDQSSMLERDINLHRAILEGSQSTVLLETWEGVISRWRGMRAIVASQAWKQDAAGDVSSHQPIVESLLEGDTKGAQHNVRHHLEQASIELRTFLTAANPTERLYVSE